MEEGCGVGRSLWQASGDRGLDHAPGRFLPLGELLQDPLAVWW
jgi:hypothetical protein